MRRGILTIAALVPLCVTPATFGQVTAPYKAFDPVGKASGDGSRLIWSHEARAGTRRYRLYRVLGTSERLLAGILSRTVPFDVDVGTDARGRAVATFSRCKHESLATERARGCELRIVDLGSLRERSAGVARPAGASDTNPSIWRGKIAFTRLYPSASGRGNEIRVTLQKGRSRLVFRERPLRRTGHYTESLDLRGLKIAWLSRTNSGDTCPGRPNVDVGSGGGATVYTLRLASLDRNITRLVETGCQTTPTRVLRSPVLAATGLTYVRYRDQLAAGTVEIVLHRPEGTTSARVVPRVIWAAPFRDAIWGVSDFPDLTVSPLAADWQSR